VIEPVYIQHLAETYSGVMYTSYSLPFSVIYNLSSWSR